ncbi:unnamed protein product [Tilletia caries]|nr:unnamed protein product [Tilletia caries]
MTEAVSPLKPGLLTKLDKDRRLLELAGYSFFYDLPDGPYLNHLDELGLTPYRKDREHNFKLALESPQAFTQEGEQLWSVFQQDAQLTTWRQLIDGSHPSLTESQPSQQARVSVASTSKAEDTSVVLGKRTRRPNSRYSDSEGDQPGPQKRQTRTASNKDSGKGLILPMKHADFSLPFAGTEYDHNEDDSEFDDFKPDDTQDPEFSDEEGLTASPAKRTRRSAPGEAHPAASDSSSSLDEEEPSQRSRHKPAAPKDTPYDLEQESQQTSASMRLVKEETEHPNIKNGTRYYRLLKSFSQIRHQQKTGAEYTVITEKWKCCFCDGEYTGHPDDRSSLSLHLNPKHSKSACKGAASIGGGQGSLNSWVVDQRQRNHEVQLSVIRHKALLWVVMDALPFTAPSRPWFRDLMLAASSVAGQGLMSARSVVADLEQLSDRLLLQAVDRIKTYAAPFAIRQDAWSSPSQRHTFVAFVVACLDPSWKHRQFVLNFLVLKGRHGGATFAGHLVTALKTHGILQHWTGIIVVDAASSNGRMSSILEQEMAEVRIFPE